MSKKIPLSPEDQALFQTEMRHVTPLKTKSTKLPAKRIHQPVIPKRRSAQVPEDMRPQIQPCADLSDYYAHPVQAESVLHYHQPGLGRQQVQALKTGNIVYQAKLDLHGLKPDAAKERLGQFLVQQIQKQHRWVLIIHGKGGRFGEAPVLKNLVNHWLPQIPSVLAFHSAQPKHGGAGALYVLLKIMS